MGGGRTNQIKTDRGLKQGCILSPLLFAIFIKGMADEIIKEKLGVQVGLGKIAILLFADDIVVISKIGKN